MKRRLAGIMIPLAAMAVQAAPAAGQEVADATCPGPPTSSRANGPGVNFGNNRWAQTFTAQNTGTLTTVQLGVASNGTLPPDWIVQILSASGGVPAASGVLGSSTIDDAVIPMSGQVTAHPSPAPAVTAGQQYAVSVTHPGGDSVGVRTVELDPCPGDLFFTGPAPDPFGPEGSTHEMVFAAFVTPTPPAVPAPAETPTTPNKCKKKAKKKGKRRSVASAKKKKKSGCKKKKRKKKS